MRLWLRLTLVMAALALIPLVLVGSLAVRTATENVTLRPEEQMSQEASTLATFVGTWVDGQARMLGGWQGVWDLRNAQDDYRLGLLRATYKAMDAAVTVALVDDANQPVVPSQYLAKGLAPEGREPGTPARADALLARAPKRLSHEGIAVGDPYEPPGGGPAVVPVAAGPPEGGVRMLAELSLAPVASVFAGRGDMAAVLVDGLGRPVLGADHPYLQTADLDALLDLGLDLTFTEDDGDGLYQGAIYAVPYTEWKVVVLAPPTMAEEAARAIRGHTMRVAGLALFVVLLVGLVIERGITRSVLDLRHHASEVTKGDYDRRNEVDRGDEVGELGLALNVMTARLETNRRELDAFHRELQDRVDARTRDLEAAQAQLVRAGQIAAVADMGAGLAHDLNNPIAAILGQIQLLQAGRGGGADAAFSRIEEHAQRCRSVVDTMLRLSSGELDASEGTSDLGEAVAAAVEVATPRLAKGQVTITTGELPAGMRTAMGPVFARRVLVQVLEALGAGLPDGARIEVHLEGADDDAVVVLTPDQAVAMDTTADDFRAAGMRLWGARGLLDLVDGRVDEPGNGEVAWRVVVPRAAS